MQTPRQSLVVSIHDVSPLTQPIVRTMLADLAEAGVSRTSLLVVPDHHKKAPVANDPSFCQEMRNLVSCGHEVVLHGYYHLRPPKQTTLLKSLITEHYTAGEGEFFDLSQNEAAERLTTAKKEFADHGLHPVGFIAPAWLLGAEAETAVKDAGFQYTTRLQTFKDLASGREDFSQSLVWSVRAAWRRVISLGWNACLLNRLGENPLVRIGLHPPDWSHPAIRRQVLRIVRATLAARDPITYEGWLQRARV